VLVDSVWLGFILKSLFFEMAPIAIPSCNLSPEQKEILIDAVRQRPAIWNCTSDEYNDIGSRKNAYSEVAALLSNDAVQYSGWYKDLYSCENLELLLYPIERGQNRKILFFEIFSKMTLLGVVLCGKQVDSSC
jgi:hypothetical protein